MGWKRYVKKAKKAVKRVTRKVVYNHERYVTRWARPLGAAAAGFFGGAAGAALFTGGTHHLHQWAATTGARSKGIRGRDARMIGRKQAKRTTMHSAAAGGVGAVAAGAASALSGGNFLSGFGVGQGGSALLGGNTIFGSAASGSLTGAVTGAGGTAAAVGSGFQTWESLTNPKGTPGEPVSGAIPWDELFGAAAGAMGSGGGSDGEEETPSLPGMPSFMNSPTGEGGESPAWVAPALAAGVAFLLLS